MEDKRCSKCKKKLAVECFYKHKGAKDGLGVQCKKCIKQYDYTHKKQRSEYHKRWYESNRESVLERSKRWYETHQEQASEQRKQYRETHREQILEQKKQYYETHREQNAEWGKRWSKAHREKVNEIQKRWRTNNPDKVKLNKRRHRSMKLSLPAIFTVKEWTDAKEYFNNCCAYCGKGKPLEQDHFYPLSKGGEYARVNIIPACRNCNSSKGVKLFSEWYPTFTHYSKKREKTIANYLNYKRGSQQLILAY
jgi:hypothetical protein